MFNGSSHQTWVVRRKRSKRKMEHLNALSKFLTNDGNVVADVFTFSLNIKVVFLPSKGFSRVLICERGRNGFRPVGPIPLAQLIFGPIFVTWKRALLKNLIFSIVLVPFFTFTSQNRNIKKKCFLGHPTNYVWKLSRTV